MQVTATKRSFQPLTLLDTSTQSTLRGDGAGHNTRAVERERGKRGREREKELSQTPKGLDHVEKKHWNESTEQTSSGSNKLSKNVLIHSNVRRNRRLQNISFVGSTVNKLTKTSVKWIQLSSSCLIPQDKSFLERDLEEEMIPRLLC